MAFIKAGSLTALPTGTVTQVEIAGEPYALCNVDGDVYALNGVCPHAGGPLGEGQLNGASVMCPWHEFEFDCRTGENDMDPTMKVDRFAVRLEAGDILVDPAARF